MSEFIYCRGAASRVASALAPAVRAIFKNAINNYIGITDMGTMPMHDGIHPP